jgi:hypothetical protein
MKGTTFTDCSLVADFMATDITDVLLTTATCIRSEFDKAIANKDFVNQPQL